ncbi:hypothetical protein CMO86_01860 [Candidatus Woesearchaeota archaeon]|jgi:hypothetical protein|nr:hypothetical protein [Candidatus Woesearchaeota archaeon]
MKTLWSENIVLPVKVGDTILTGRFKNKKVVVKSIGKDDHGMPTINGRRVVNFRIVKESFEVEFPKDMPMDENSEQVLKALNLGLKKINRKFKGASLDGKTIDIELHPGHNKDSEIYQIYDLLKKLKIDARKTSIFNESINESVNTFFYDDMKKYIYKNRGKINKVMKSLPDEKKYDFLEKLYVKLFKGPTYRMAEKDIKGKGKELHQMLVKDKYIKEIYYDNLGNKCPGPVTLDGRCLGGRNTYQKEGVGMNRSLHKGKGKDGGDNLTEPVNEVGIFKISQFTKGIIPQGRLDTHTPEKKKEAIKLIKNFHSMLNAFWRENDIPYRARLR